MTPAPGDSLRLPRAWFAASDPLYGDTEPFDVRSAWVDLYQLAAHQAEVRAVKGTPIPVARGQLVASEAFLAERWGWSRKSVRLYLTRLTQCGRVSIDRDHALSHRGAILTIRNYATYAGGD